MYRQERLEELMQKKHPVTILTIHGNKATGRIIEVNTVEVVIEERDCLNSTKYYLAIEAIDVFTITENTTADT